VFQNFLKQKQNFSIESKKFRTKPKQSLITTIMEVFSNIPREATKRACSPFRSRLEKVVAVKGDFIH
jgi:hypothetical protein